MTDWLYLKDGPHVLMAGSLYWLLIEQENGARDMRQGYRQTGVGWVVMSGFTPYGPRWEPLADSETLIACQLTAPPEIQIEDITPEQIAAYFKSKGWLPLDECRFCISHAAKPCGYCDDVLQVWFYPQTHEEFWQLRPDAFNYEDRMVFAVRTILRHTEGRDDEMILADMALIPKGEENGDSLLHDSS